MGEGTGGVGRLVDGVLVACPVCGGEATALPTSGTWDNESPHDLPTMTVRFLVKHRCQRTRT